MRRTIPTSICRRVPAWAGLSLAAFAAACSTTDGAEPAAEPEPTSELGRQGEQIYRGTIDDGNSFTCATCHALVEPASDFRRPGHPLGDAAGRPSYKNGALDDLGAAVNSCLVEWMNADPWERDDDRWLALKAFLSEVSPTTSPALSFEIAPQPDSSDLAGGNADAGRELFNGSCAVCHGTEGTGTNQGLPIAGRGLDPGYIGVRVRTSGRTDSEVYEGLSGGVMPFWAIDRLSDTELSDIVAWLSQDSGTAPGGTMDGGTSDGGPGDDGTSGASTDGGPTGTDCPSTHPKVGQTAQLEMFFHDVGGVATMLDDCTIRITNFTYDATGIDVRLYGGLGGDYDAGFAMGDDLVSPTPFEGQTVDFRLPDGMTLDDLDGVSVWCVDVGIDFGSGSFQ